MEILLTAAIVPTIVLICWIYARDKVEKEPIGLLVKIFILGALSTITAVIFGTILDEVGYSLFEHDTSIGFILFDNFIATALVEEWGKRFAMKIGSWKNKNFNCSFDAIVYAVCAALGFATLENILYVLDSDLTVAVVRGILSVPGHVVDAIFMGAYYGLAKEADLKGDRRKRNHYLRMSLLIPTLTHGFYDFCLSVDSEALLVAFLIFEVVITIVVIRKVRKLSREDHSLV